MVTGNLASVNQNRFLMPFSAALLMDVIVKIISQLELNRQNIKWKSTTGLADNYCRSQGFQATKKISNMSFAILKNRAIYGCSIY